MAIAVVRSAQSAGSSANSSLTITAPTAGNILVSFFSQTNGNTPTLTGWTVNATKAVYNASAASVWVAYKVATGSETSIAWTPGTSATGEGVCYWEISGAGASVTLDGTPVHTDNLSAATGGLAVTTTIAGSIVLIGVGASSSSGTISAWTGTNVATNIGTAAARCFGGSFITTSTIGSTFTANWATSRATAMLGIAIQPAGGATFNDSGSGTITLSGAKSESQSHTVSGSGTVTLSGTFAQSASFVDSRAGTITLSGSGTQSQTHTATAAGTVTLSGASAQSQTHTASGTGTVTLSGSGVENFQPPGDGGSSAASEYDQTPEILVQRHPH